MQTIQRKFAKLGTRSADESGVALLLKDFDDTDNMLQRLIESAKAWQDAWRDILTFQERMVAEFHGLYTPIAGAGQDHTALHEPVITPEENLTRVSRLQEAYSELKSDLLEDIGMVDERIIRPATDARTSLHPLKKVIKKREDRKLDYERYQSKYDSATKKTSRTDKERIALAKAESDLAIAKQEYETADDKLRTSMPPIITATFSLLPYLLNAQIMIQNNLLGHYYTQLHNYCEVEGFPSPPPPMSEVISVWQNDFRPLQEQVEAGFVMLANRRGARTPLQQENRQPSATARLGNGLRGASGQRPSVSPARSEQSEPPSPNYGTKPSPSLEPDYNTRTSLVPSQGSLALSTPNYASPDTSPSPGAYLTPHAPAGPRADYFSRDRGAGQNLAAAAAGKKKPPPPPPKRTPSDQGFWVTAIYDFAGQGQGDLVFSEGDRIKVIKKTDSTDDWWEGELKGVRGPFPANYCKA